jgi:hypothetical protein
VAAVQTHLIDMIIIKGLKGPTLLVEAIQLSAEVEYFELTSNKSLTSGAQLDKVISRACRVFWSCRGTSE